MKAKNLKLSFKNDWEHITYYVGKKALADIKEVSIQGKKYKVSSYRANKDYNDMGHTYTAYFKQFYITHKVFNKNQDSTLDELLQNKVAIFVDLKNIEIEED